MLISTEKHRGFIDVGSVMAQDVLTPITSDPPASLQSRGPQIDHPPIRGPQTLPVK
jgi:hypothetical protein